MLYEWREPRHNAFVGRNVWSLFNAFTESLKEGNLAELPKRMVCSILMLGCLHERSHPRRRIAGAGLAFH